MFGGRISSSHTLGIQSVLSVSWSLHQYVTTFIGSVNFFRFPGVFLWWFLKKKFTVWVRNIYDIIFFEEQDPDRAHILSLSERFSGGWGYGLNWSLTGAASASALMHELLAGFGMDWLSQARASVDSLSLGPFHLAAPNSSTCFPSTQIFLHGSIYQTNAMRSEYPAVTVENWLTLVSVGFLRKNH